MKVGRLTATAFSSPQAFASICSLLERSGAVLQLVLRSEEVVSRNCIDFLERLSPFLVQRAEVSEWPGTKLLGNGTASLFRFSGGKLLAGELIGDGRRLSDWIHPNLPEDPSILDADGSLLFVSVTHEKDAELFVDIDRA